MSNRTPFNGRGNFDFSKSAVLLKVVILLLIPIGLHRSLEFV
jgi:hypothetical protein